MPRLREPKHQRTPEQIVDDALMAKDGTQAKSDGPAAGNGAHGEPGYLILNDIEAFLARFIAYPSEHARVAHVLWIAHAHLMDVWDSTPRIGFLSAEPASGKSRALEVSELLVPDPVTSVNMSAAFLFRRVGGGVIPPTILYDEIDTVFGDKARDNEDIRGLLNAGHRRGAVAGRCVIRNGAVETEEIPAYSAVALAGLGWLPDTILTRAVIVRMRKRKEGERVEPFRRRLQEAPGHQLRDRLAAWAHAVESGLRGVFPDLPAEVQDRDADKWEPLLSVADAAGGEWPMRAQAAAIALVKASQDDTPSLGVRLLADIKIAFGDAAKMATSELLARLNAMPEAPWGDLRGKPLDDRGLARKLKPYEIKSKTVRIEGEQKPKHGYDRADLADAWDRYLPPPPQAQGSVTSVTSVTTGAPNGDPNADVTPVTDVTPICSRACGDGEPYNTVNDAPALEHGSVTDVTGEAHPPAWEGDA